MLIAIWYRYADQPPERIAVVDARTVDTRLREYAVSYGTAEGLHRHGLDKLWAGTQGEEPWTTTASSTASPSPSPSAPSVSP